MEIDWRFSSIHFRVSKHWMNLKNSLVYLSMFTLIIVHRYYKIVILHLMPQIVKINECVQLCSLQYHNFIEFYSVNTFINSIVASSSAYLYIYTEYHICLNVKYVMVMLFRICHAKAFKHSSMHSFWEKKENDVARQIEWKINEILFGEFVCETCTHISFLSLFKTRNQHICRLWIRSGVSSFVLLLFFLLSFLIFFTQSKYKCIEICFFSAHPFCIEIQKENHTCV